MIIPIRLAVFSILLNFALLLPGQFIGSSLAATIAISIPLSGDFAQLGRNFRTGAKLAMEQIENNHELFIADDGCDADLSKLAAEEIDASSPSVVIGFLCNDSAKTVAGKVASKGIPVLVAGARSVRLIKDREREAWNLWRLSPGDDYPINIAAQEIEQRWRDRPYAIVDDGTIYGRTFTDGLRLRMQEAGFEPQFSDSFRAAQSSQVGLLRRLKRSGVTAAFVAAATVEDLLTIARNMRDFDIELELMTTEALQALPFLEDGGTAAEGVQIILSAQPFDMELDALLRDRSIAPSRQLYDGYAAIQIALEALRETSEKTTQSLANSTFETVLGAIGFKPDGSADYNPYEWRIWNGENLISSDQAAETQ